MPEPQRIERGAGVVLFGGGGHARAVRDVLWRLDVPVTAVVDPGGLATDVLVSDEAGLRHARRNAAAAVLALGDNGRRLRLARLLTDGGVQLPPVVAMTATVAVDAVLGAGTVVMEHAHVGAASELGDACVVNTGAVVEHDCRLADGVHCGPRSVLAGAVCCGTRVLVGAGAVALPGMAIGGEAVVGAGSVVVNAVPAGQTVVGVPAQAKAAGGRT